MIEILEKIFGGAAKVKIMRLFLFNPTETFDITEIMNRAKVMPSPARQEIEMMRKIGLIKKKNSVKEVVVGSGKKKKILKKKVAGYMLDDSFEYLTPLQVLLTDISPMRNTEILKRLNRVGKLKFVVVAGAFIQNWDSRVDLLIVGDNIKKTSLENIIKTIESEVGREIRYAWFETSDFTYRLGVYDKLIRDILDFPHQKILDKIGVTPSK